MTKILIAMLALSMTAFAGQDRYRDYGDNQQHGHNQQHNSSDSSLDDLIVMCERLDRNPQIKKFGAEVTCRGHKTMWNLKTTKEFDLKTKLVIRAEVSMKGDRYKVNGYTRRKSSDPATGECNIYQETRQDYLPVTVKLNSCTELRELQKEGRAQFCARTLADAPFESEAKATGRTKSTCGRTRGHNQQHSGDFK